MIDDRDLIITRDIYILGIFWKGWICEYYVPNGNMDWRLIHRVFYYNIVFVVCGVRSQDQLGCE